MTKYELPVDYTLLKPKQRKEVREQYIEEQEGECMYCSNSLREEPTDEVLSKSINWELFPPNFLKYPVHLQHNHDTGMTEGAVHAFCNAVLWVYEGK